MKKLIPILIVIIILVVWIMFLPSKKRPEEKINFAVGINPSENTTILIHEIPSSELQPEQYNKDQIYIKNIDIIYKSVSFNQADKINEELQKYLKDKYSSKIKECLIEENSISFNLKYLQFSVKINDNSIIPVKALKDEHNKIVYLIINNGK